MEEVWQMGGASAQLSVVAGSRNAALAMAERHLESVDNPDVEGADEDSDQVALTDLVSPVRPAGTTKFLDDDSHSVPMPPQPEVRTVPGPIVPHKPTKGRALDAPPVEQEQPPMDTQTSLMDQWKGRADSFKGDVEIPTDKPLFSPDLLSILRDHPQARSMDKIVEAAARVRRMPFWDTLSPAEQTQDVWLPLLQHAELLEGFDEGTLLLNQDNAMEALFVVLCGGVTAMLHANLKQFASTAGQVQSVTSIEQTYRFIAPGESFGSLMVGKMKGADTVANAGSATGNRDVKSITIARANTMVLRLDPYRVEKVFEGVMETHLLRRAMWLQGTKLFEMWNFDDLKDIAGLMQTKRFSSNQLICKQGEPGTELYLITQGSCRVVREIVVPYTLVRGGYNRTPSDVLEHISTPMVSALNRLAQGALTVKKDHLETARCAAKLYSADAPKLGRGRNVDHSAIRKKVLDAESKEITSNRGTFVGSLSRINEQQRKAQDAAARKKAKKLQKELGAKDPKTAAFEKSTRSLVVEIRKLWKGSFFGELSLINKEPKTASVIASTSVEVLVLSKMDFFRHFDEKMVSWVRELGEQAGYTTDDKTLYSNLAFESNWADYKQSLVSDKVYGARHSNAYTKEFVKDLLKDPTTIASVTLQPEPYPKMSSLQIRKVDDR